MTVSSTATGAAAQTGPWTTFASIVVKPADGAWTTLQSSDSSTFAFVRYHSPKGGFCNVAEIEFYPPSAWGWALSTVLILGGAACEFHCRSVASQTPAQLLVSLTRCFRRLQMWLAVWYWASEGVQGTRD